MVSVPMCSKKKKSSIFIIPFALVFFGSLSFNISVCDGAKILIYCVQASYSMLHVYHPYAVKLAERGHDVTLLIGYKYKNPHPKITYIAPEIIVQALKNLTTFVGENSIQGRERNYGKFQLRADSLDGGWSSLPPGGLRFCEILLSDPKILEWVNSPHTKFDLVVVDGLWNDCGIGLAYKFQAPHILFETCTITTWAYDTFGLPPENSVLPDIRRLGLVLGQMTFMERVRNALDTLEMYVFYRQLSHIPTMDEIIRKGLNVPEMPSLKQLEKNVSLVFINAHYTTEAARSLPPLFVQVGGLQVEESVKQSELPRDLAQFIEKYDAFVYVSFGTIFRLNSAKQQVFLETFRQFPKLGFVFLWTGDMPAKESVSQNTFLVSWAPQTQLLANKKIRAFISHGGMMSSQESVFYGVPLVVIPGFNDQDYNAECLKRLGVAVKLELVGITVEQLVAGIKEVLFNPSYLERMKKVSSLHRDRPEHPMETAFWWTEYVIRNTANGNGLDHLKPLGINQYWFQRRMLDVWFFLLAVTIAIISLFAILLFKVVSCILSLRSGKGNDGRKKMKRK